MIKASYYDVIKRPVITEKATDLSEHNKTTFLVAPSADKATIKKAVESIFEVKVKAVNVINQAGKVKKFRGHLGKRSNYRKAIVTLEEGHNIDIAGGN